MIGTLERPRPTVVAFEPVFRREYITRSLIERYNPSAECPRRETKQRSHFEKCWLRFVTKEYTRPS